MKLKSLLLACTMAGIVSSGGAQTLSQSGTLSAAPAAFGFDWHYLHTLDQPRSALFNQGVPIKVQTRFTYGGNSGNIPGSQHAVLALTQMLADDRFQNNQGEGMWTHGAGAIVTEYGLALELWFRNPAPGGSYWGQPSNAIVWSSLNNRCAQDVLGTMPGNTMCLLDTDQYGGSYITTNPGWVFKRQTAYTLRITYTPQPNGWVTMTAELLEARNNWFGWVDVVVQRGSVGFQVATFFPDVAQFAQVSVARTPGTITEPTVAYSAYLGGF